MCLPESCGEGPRGEPRGGRGVDLGNLCRNNSGDMMSRDQLTSIAAFATHHDLKVISDEAYEDVIYDREHVSIASLAGPALPWAHGMSCARHR